MTTKVNPENVDPGAGDPQDEPFQAPQVDADGVIVEKGATAVSAFAGTAMASLTGTRTPEEIQAQIVGRILNAPTLDALFDQWEVTKSDALVGRSFEIVDVTWGTFNAESGPVPLAQVTAVDLRDKTACSWISTAPNITAFLYRAEQLEAFPFKVRIASNRTSRGYDALHFERVE